MKRAAMGALLVSALSGCISQPAAPAHTLDLTGNVSSRLVLTRAAYVRVHLYEVVAGQPRRVAKSDYRVSALPLGFSFHVPAATDRQWLIRSELAWSEAGSVQARGWRQVVPGQAAQLQLTPLMCYPNCRINTPW